MRVTAEDISKMNPRNFSSFLQSEDRDPSSTPGSPAPEQDSVFNNDRKRGSMAQWSPISPYRMSPWTMSAPAPAKTPSRACESYGCISSMVRQDGHVYAIAAAGDILYTGSESKNIRVWKHPRFEEYGCLKSGSGSVKALLVVGRRIFSAHHDRRIRVWERPGGRKSRHERVATLPTVKDRVQRCMNPKNYVQVRRHRSSVWINHVDAISSLACNVERGLLYSGSWDKTVKVWRMSDFRCVESIAAHHDAVNALAVRRDGSLFTGSADGTVKRWVCVTASAKHLLAEVLRIGQPWAAVNALAVAAEGDAILYAGCSDGVIGWWDERSVCGSLRGHDLAILCLATAGGLVFSGSADRTVGIWRREAGGLHSRLAALEGHAGPVKCIASGADVARRGRCVVYTGSLDRSVKVWSVSLDQDADDNYTKNAELRQ